MSSNDKALQRVGDDEEKDIVLKDGVIERLSPLQLKYCQLTVNTTLDRQEVAQTLGVSKRMLTSWDKNPDLRLYMNFMKKKAVKSMTEGYDRVNRLVAEKASVEILSRFDEPDPDMDLEDDATEWERKTYHQRFAKNASFRDFTKFFGDFQKMSRELEDGGEGDEEEMIEMVRTRYHRSKMQRRAIQDKFDQAGFDPMSMFKTSVLEMNADGSYEVLEESEDAISDYDVVEVETFSILKRKEKK